MLNKFKILLSADPASGNGTVVLPKNAKDVKGVRSIMTSIKTQLCSTAEAFNEPLKALFGEVAKKFEAVITALPADDAVGDWSLECQLDNLFSCLTCASSAASGAALEASKIREEKEKLSRQYASDMEAEITKRINAGDLFTKEAHTQALQNLVPQTQVQQLCAAAEQKGLEAGMKKLQDQHAAEEARRTTIATRKTALQQANFPIPDAAFESVLGGKDEEFTAAKTKVESRRDALKKKGVQLNTSELLSNLWLPDAEWNVFEKTVSGIPALKIVAEPFAAGTGSSGTGPKRTLVV